ncbi:MAG TPA: DJ-1/PfpI family protein [Microthrixaceae bacterium]|nr:DJ-1/PfpI family protein [Microthrixaceae bacterium]
MTTTIAIAVYPGLTLLDVIGPYQVLALLPDVEVVVCAAERGRLTDDRGLVHLDVERTFDDVAGPDVLLVGGGFGNRRLLGADSPIVEWIRASDATTSWTTSVCTGSLLLGAAGLLVGRTASTHWNCVELLEGFGATYSSDRVSVDGKYLTGAGVSAGIDLALQLAAQLRGRGRGPGHPAQHRVRPAATLRRREPGHGRTRDRGDGARGQRGATATVAWSPCPTDWPTRPARTCVSTPTTRSTGGRSATRRSSSPDAPTDRF